MKKIDDLLKDGIIDAVSKINDSINIEHDMITIEIPKDTTHGDYATNIALKKCRDFSLKPMEVAQLIKDNFDYDKFQVKSIDIAMPGFINFFMANQSLVSIITKAINEGDDFGQITRDQNYVMNVEYVSANPTGDLHLGHARQASLGDSITRIYLKAGYRIVREYYLNDAGNQINNLAYSAIARYKQLFNIDCDLPEDGYYGQDIIDIATEIKDKYQDKYLNDESVEAFNFFKKYSVEFEVNKLKKDLKDFNCEFDVWTSEQGLYDSGKVEKTLEQLKQTPYLFEEEGALWLKSTDFKDDKDRVLRKSDGSYTYLMPDIANHIQKLEAGADYMLDLWGADHHGYINRVKASLEILTGRNDSFDVSIVQMVRLIKDGDEVKMSKRTGNAIGLRELCEEVGVDAVRYFFASRAGTSHFDFDLDLATSKSNDNPVFYAQYAHARICSIIEASHELKLDNNVNLGLLDHPKEIELMKFIHEFSSTIDDAATFKSPHRITNYIQKLASCFHSYYNECKVIEQSNIELTKARLELLKACKITLRNALDLVGVSAPEKM